MCPVFEPDFTKVYAQTPVWPKGVYEMNADKVSGTAYEKVDEETQKKTLVMSVNIRPKLVGVVGSNGKPSTTLDGADIKGKDAEPIKLYIHSEGAMGFSKRIMMAILGYDKSEEEKFNEFWKKGNWKFPMEEEDDGRLSVNLEGTTWLNLAGKNFRAAVSKEIRKTKEGVEFEVQSYDSILMVK